jgi:hypothetical protein
MKMSTSDATYATALYSLIAPAVFTSFYYFKDADVVQMSSKNALKEVMCGGFQKCF